MDYTKLVNIKIDSIIKAAKDMENNPVKAEAYIRKTVTDIFKAGKMIGSNALIDELFG